MRFLFRFVKLFAAFVKILLRVSAVIPNRRRLSSRHCMPLPSSLAAVHVAAFVRVLKSHHENRTADGVWLTLEASKKK